jgi:hypothetical protein
MLYELKWGYLECFSGITGVRSHKEACFRRSRMKNGRTCCLVHEIVIINPFVVMELLGCPTLMFLHIDKGGHLQWLAIASRWHSAFLPDVLNISNSSLILYVNTYQISPSIGTV